MSLYWPISVYFRVRQFFHSNWNAKRRGVIWKNKPSDCRERQKGNIQGWPHCHGWLAYSGEEIRTAWWIHLKPLRMTGKCCISFGSDLKVMHGFFFHPQYDSEIYWEITGGKSEEHSIKTWPTLFSPSRPQGPTFLALGLQCKPRDEKKEEKERKYLLKMIIFLFSAHPGGLFWKSQWFNLLAV